MSRHDSDPTFQISSNLVDEWARLCPTQATFIGVVGHDHRWDDFGPSGHGERLKSLMTFRERILELPPTEDRWSQLARQVMVDHCDTWIDTYENHDHWLDLNSIESSFQVLRQVFDVMDVTTSQGWENVVARLETFEAAASSYQKTLAEGLRHNRVVARRQVLATLEQGRRHAGDQSFFLGLLTQLDAMGGAFAPLRSRLEAGIARTRGAYATLCTFLEVEYLPKAPVADGVGRERYVRCARRHLGLEIDPLETYAWGWSEVRRIEAEMETICQSLGLAPSLKATIDVLTTDPKRCTPTPQAFIEFIHQRQMEALDRLSDSHFDVPAPARTVEVKIAPPGGALGAYYIPPSDGFARPGSIWYSMGDERVVPIFDEISTAYHEGFPGHHLQCSVQVHLAQKLSRFQRLVAMNTGYAEGWALYAEQLMNELGFLDLPEYVLGMLSKQLMRAYRVVVDIGLHLDLEIPKDFSWRPGERWNFEIAVEAMHGRVFLNKPQAESEVTRYMGWPGQAIAYHVGLREILQLRETLKARKGDDFVLKDFHSRFLELGSVGLGLLRVKMLE